MQSSPSDDSTSFHLSANEMMGLGGCRKGSVEMQRAAWHRKISK